MNRKSTLYKHFWNKSPKWLILTTEAPYIWAACVSQFINAYHDILRDST